MTIRFRTKLFLGFFLFAVVISGAIILFVHFYLADLPVAVTRELVRVAAANAAAQVDPADVAAVAALPATVPGNSGTASAATGPAQAAAQQRLERVLARIHESPPRFDSVPGARRDGAQKMVFIMVRAPQAGQGRIVAAYPQRGSPDPARQPVADWSPAMEEGWKAIAVEQAVSHGAFGRKLSAYAPILDGRGQTIAILGVEAPGVWVERFDAVITGAAVIMYFLALSASAVPAVFIAWRLNRPINRLSDGMVRVSKGELDWRIAPIPSRDELEALTHQFNQMVDGLQERERLKRSMDLAAHVQQHLLPPAAPKIEGFDISGGSAYCDETGGDYYDFIPLADSPGSKLGVAVGDVAGHGIGAALMMASARALLRSRVRQHGDHLAELLTALNEDLLFDASDGRFTTLFFGVLDAGARTLTWGSAGHEPALWFKAADRSVQELRNTGMPLGVSDEAGYQQAGPAPLAKGDVLIISSDGVREARDGSGQEFGADRLNGVVAQSAGADAAAIRAALLRAVTDFRGNVRIEDDMTLVVIKVL